ncbi:TraB/GumN family protein [Exilibacterium tricleocarpae]|uniref:TraB/GumN family protein n=1 Tax=Exilibacterium tricleocarpae TaxID=2591008 RepID=A0A545TM38_9GAMM|nr:TraB/GumN family protein [Exilibacterium tricleocarpae]TQV78238.1 TraB/GumN family protein [Exilibacterium tricleocarpae]
MRYIVWLRVLVVTLAVAALPAGAAGPVWQVSKGERHLFVGGTIHLLSQADYPLPAAFDQAYKQAARVVFEVDIEAVKSPAFQQSMLAQLRYSDGRDLRSVLKPETYRALEQHLSSRGIPAFTVLSLKPGMLAMTLTLIELQRLGLAGTGVDEFYSNRAAADGKALGHLETAEQQLRFLTQLGVGQEDEVVVYTLRDIERLPALMKSMKAAWRSGDNGALQKVGLAPWEKEFPEVYDTLLVQRNNAWMPQLEAMLKTAEVELVLVGALHLVGEHGLLAQLAARGYTIRQL